MKLEPILQHVDQHKTIEDILPVAKEIFRLILEEGKWLDQFFLHPLGFYYCRLYADTHNQIRLHIWEPNYPVKKDLFIHDHFYDLCSWILCGKILDYTYEVKPTDSINEYALFKSSYLSEKKVRTLTRTNEYRNVNKVEEKTISKFSKYIIPRETFHSNKILFDEINQTVTFVYTFNHKEDNAPNVIGLASNKEYQENNPISIPAEKVKILIQNAIDNIWNFKK